MRHERARELVRDPQLCINIPNRSHQFSCEEEVELLCIYIRVTVDALGFDLLPLLLITVRMLVYCSFVYAYLLCVLV